MELTQRIRAHVGRGEDLEARLLTAAWLTRLARAEGIRPVIVGGAAVDFYTAQTLRPDQRPRVTMDIDVVALDAGGQDQARRLRRVLAAAGFRPVVALAPEDARALVHDEAAVGVDVLGGGLHGSLAHTRTLDIEGEQAVLWGPEDTYWHYLQAAHATTHRGDYVRAQAMLRAHGDTFDWGYVESLARAQGLGGPLAASRRGDPFELFMEA